MSWPSPSAWVSPATGCCSRGPAKTDDELAASVRYGLRTINVESLGEAQRLDSIVAAGGALATAAAPLRRRQPILLRVNARFEVHDADAAVQLGGGAQKFGVDEEQLDDVLPQLLKLRHLDLQGVHVFAATGVLESSLLVEYTRHVFGLVQRLEQDYRRRFPVVDLGGGLGVDYRTFPGRDLDLAHYASSLRDLIAAFGFGDKEIALELGRYLVGEAGTYVVRVLDVKHSRGTDYALVDGGDESLPAPGSGSAGPSGDVGASPLRLPPMIVEVRPVPTPSADRSAPRLM